MGTDQGVKGCLADKLEDVDSPERRVERRPVPEDDGQVAKAQWRRAAPLRDGHLLRAGWARHERRSRLVDPFADGFRKHLRQIFILGLEFVAAKRA